MEPSIPANALLDGRVQLPGRGQLLRRQLLPVQWQEGLAVVQAIEEQGVEGLEALRQQQRRVVAGDDLKRLGLPPQDLDGLFREGVAHMGPEASPA